MTASDGSPDEHAGTGAPRDEAPGVRQASRTGGVRRRTLLGLAALALAGSFAGCNGGDGGGRDTQSCRDRAPDDLSGPVPEPYGTAHARVEDYTRDPDQLISKETAGYQHEPKFENKCGNCGKFVPDKNGDCLGACVRVSGLIEPWGWCEYYSDASGVSW